VEGERKKRKPSTYEKKNSKKKNVVGLRLFGRERPESTKRKKESFRTSIRKQYSKNRKDERGGT